MRNIVLLGAAALAASALGNDGMTAWPGEGRRHKPRGAYVPKTPSTPNDFARLEAAERKRARKAAKLRALTGGAS